MAKRIRIRKAVTVTAIAAALSIMMVAPASAYETTTKDTQSQACNVDPRIANNEPQLCQRQVFSNTQEVAPAEPTSTPSSTSSSTPWALYSALVVLVLAAATFSAFRGRPQIVS